MTCLLILPDIFRTTTDIYLSNNLISSLAASKQGGASMLMLWVYDITGAPVSEKIHREAWNVTSK